MFDKLVKEHSCVCNKVYRSVRAGVLFRNLWLGYCIFIISTQIPAWYIKTIDEKILSTKLLKRRLQNSMTMEQVTMTTII